MVVIDLLFLRDGCGNFLYIDSKWLQYGEEPWSSQLDLSSLIQLTKLIYDPVNKTVFYDPVN